MCYRSGSRIKNIINSRIDRNFHFLICEFLFYMVESKIQKKIINKLESEGWFVIKLIKTNKNGIPDLLAIKESRTIFIEVKQEKGVLSTLQKYQINEIRSKKIEAYIWTSYGVNFDRQDPYIFKQ